MSATGRPQNANGSLAEAKARSAEGAPVIAPGHSLTVELFTEELPPKALKALGEAFAEVLFNDLVKMGFHDGVVADMSWFATPRRLGVTIKHVLPVAPD